MRMEAAWAVQSGLLQCKTDVMKNADADKRFGCYAQTQQSYLHQAYCLSQLSVLTMSCIRNHCMDIA